MENKLIEEGLLLGYNVKLYSNNYLNSLSNFWKIKTMFKKEIILDFLKNNNYCITNIGLENFFRDSKVTFFINKDKTILLSYKSELFEEMFDELQEISLINAFKIFNLDQIEEAGEKGYSQLINF